MGKVKVTGRLVMPKKARMVRIGEIVGTKLELRPPVLYQCPKCKTIALLYPIREGILGKEPFLEEFCKDCVE